MLSHFFLHLLKSYTVSLSLFILLLFLSFFFPTLFPFSFISLFLSLSLPLSSSLFWQIIDSIIEESQKDNGGDEGLLRSDQGDNERKTEERQGAEDQMASAASVSNQMPEVLSGVALVPAASHSDQMARVPEQEQEVSLQEDVGVLAVEAPGASIFAGPSATQKLAPAPTPLPPDITSALGGRDTGAESFCAGGGETEPRPADILEQVPLADKMPQDQDQDEDQDPSGPTKPPRQFTVEPDIVASTKKAPPSRPPPPGGAPPPRPPPPTRPTLPPSKKSQEAMRPTALAGKTSLFRWSTHKGQEKAPCFNFFFGRDIK